MSNNSEFSIIIESYNLSEGGALDRFRTSLHTALAMVKTTQRRGEVLVVDVTNGDVESMLQTDFPEIRRVSAAGLGYDAAKMERALQQSSADYLLYLDGDCIPQKGWLESLLIELDAGTGAVGGLTVYDGGFLAKIMSVMDFGFFYPSNRRPLKCYASNNCGFNRATLIAQPVPTGDQRCKCYHHAQCLLRSETPMYLIPSAMVLHEMPPILRERTRQGYDVVTAGREDPQTTEARFLKFGPFALFPLYMLQVLLDWQRIVAGRKVLKLSKWQLMFAIPLFPFFRLLDLVGMIYAFFRGPVKGGWGGFELSRRSVTSADESVRTKVA
jgi:Glycosyl transferase family 2